MHLPGKHFDPSVGSMQPDLFFDLIRERTILSMEAFLSWGGKGMGSLLVSSLLALMMLLKRKPTSAIAQKSRSSNPLFHVPSSRLRGATFPS